MKIQTWTLFLGIVCCTTAVVGQQDGPKADFADHSIISRDVVVATDDTFQTIAKRELGRAGLAQQLADYNGLPESTQLSCVASSFMAEP